MTRYHEWRKSIKAVQSLHTLSDQKLASAVFSQFKGRMRKLSEHITPEDVAIFQVERGSVDGQQIWEALAMLIALKLWASELTLNHMS